MCIQSYYHIGYEGAKIEASRKENAYLQIS